MSRLGRPSIVVLAWIGLASAPSHAADCGSLEGSLGYPLENGTNIVLINESPSVFSTEDFERAKMQWQTCPGLGSQFPGVLLESEAGSGRPVTIEHVAGENPNLGGGCEQVQRNIAGHTLVAATITIYTQQNKRNVLPPLG